MIPNAEQLRAISQMTKGDLGEIPFPVLLQALAVHKRSVVLSIERRQLKKEIILENGIPVDCHSNLLQDTLGKFMVARGALNDEQNHQILSKSATTGQPFVEILVADGMINASELYKILQQNLAKKLLDGFTWRSGKFQVSADLPQGDSPLKVKAPQLVLTGISKFAPEDEIAEAIAGLEGKRILINPRPPFPLKELRLTKDHQEILGLVSLGKTTEELEAESGMEKAKMLRLLYSLAVIGVALPEDWIVHDAIEATPDMDFTGVVAAEPEPAPAATTPTVDVDKLKNEVMEAYLLHRKQDAFDLIGIADDATLEQVDEAYLAFCEKYAPWNMGQPGLESLMEKVRDLFIAGGRAFGELCNPETRKSLVARRNSAFKTKLVPEEARNAFAIKSNLLDSETQFNKGIELLNEGKYADAIEQLQFAYDCEPQNSEYRAELAFCKYRKDPQIEKDNSLQELRETLRIDPDSGLALYYAGMIFGEIGDFTNAEPFLQRAIKLMQPDRRPIDALRQFKTAERDKPKKSTASFSYEKTQRKGATSPRRKEVLAEREHFASLRPCVLASLRWFFCAVDEVTCGGWFWGPFWAGARNPRRSWSRSRPPAGGHRFETAARPGTRRSLHGSEATTAEFRLRDRNR